jgi:branched-chain amino acid transport system permease protein
VRTVIIDGIGVLSTAGTLFIVSAGLTLVFGAMRLINIAHGSFYMYGAFLVATLAGTASGLRFWAALLASAVVVALIGVVAEAGIMRRIYDTEHLTQLIATFGLFLILADLALHLWGSNTRTVSLPAAVAGHLTVAGATFPSYDLVIIGGAIVVGVELGWRIRAAVEDPESLQGGGTNLRLLRTGVFALGAFLAGLSGALIAPGRRGTRAGQRDRGLGLHRGRHRRAGLGRGGRARRPHHRRRGNPRHRGRPQLGVHVHLPGHDRRAGGPPSGLLGVPEPRP